MGERNHRMEIGKQGEEIACRFLEGMGHVILERNYRCGHLEIDIISKDPDGIHFVEVKTRKKNIQAPPQENVDIKKQKRITSAALRYLNNGKVPDGGNRECFFDIIAITIDRNGEHLEWFPQAYIPIYYI